MVSSAMASGSGTTPVTETSSSGEEPQETIGGSDAAAALGGPTRDKVRVYAHVGNDPARLKQRKAEGFTAFKTS